MLPMRMASSSYEKWSLAMTSQSLGQSVFQAVAQALKDFWRRQARVTELQALGTAELGRMAHDLSLTSADLRELVTHESDAARLLYRRLALAGINPGMIDPAVLRDLQRCCSQCEDQVLCEHELEDKPLSAEWPDYCPNKQTIEALTSVRCH
jgi:hypothetical protein